MKVIDDKRAVIIKSDHKQFIEPQIDGVADHIAGFDTLAEKTEHGFFRLHSPGFGKNVDVPVKKAHDGILVMRIKNAFGWNMIVEYKTDFLAVGCLNIHVIIHKASSVILEKIYGADRCTHHFTNYFQQ